MQKPGTDTHRSRWQALDQLLSANTALWQTQPFQQPDWKPPLAPALLQKLSQLSDEDVVRLQASDDAIMAWFHDDLPFVAGLKSLLQEPDLPTIPEMPNRWSVGIPGRKWEQVSGFAATLGPITQPVCEWCSGKAHLGRLLHRLSGQAATGLEYNSDIISTASALNPPVTIHHCDVMKADIRRELASLPHVVALHACGELHRQLFVEGSRARVKRISVAPCCYHLGGGPDKAPYQPLSQFSSCSSLKLHRIDLRSAVRQTVNAGEAECRRRDQIQAYRLGFEALRKVIGRRQQYLTLPSRLGKDSHSFSAFVVAAARYCGLALPTQIDWDHWEQHGQQSLQRVRRLLLIGMLFRRALEQWLLLDYAIYLEEQGYECQLLRFCDGIDTPRNLMLDARRG